MYSQLKIWISKDITTVISIHFLSCQYLPWQYSVVPRNIYHAGNLFMFLVLSIRWTVITSDSAMIVVLRICWQLVQLNVTLISFEIFATPVLVVVHVPLRWFLIRYALELIFSTLVVAMISSQNFSSGANRVTSKYVVGWLSRIIRSTNHS
jgi:hypothetical protein